MVSFNNCSLIGLALCILIEAELALARGSRGIISGADGDGPAVVGEWCFCDVPNKNEKFVFASFHALFDKAIDELSFPVEYVILNTIDVRGGVLGLLQVDQQDDRILPSTIEHSLAKG